MSEDESIPDLRQLGAQYRRELRDLVDLGEISPALAARIMDDLFEAGVEGRPRQLKWSAWHAYVEGQLNLAAIIELRGE